MDIKVKYSSPPMVNVEGENMEWENVWYNGLHRTADLLILTATMQKCRWKTKRCFVHQVNGIT